MARALPFRADNKISQAFNDGDLAVFDVSDAADTGKMPVKKLTLKGRLRYEAQKVGLNRFYLAKQNNVEVKLVLRCPWKDEVSTQDAVIPLDGNVYRIEQKQSVPGVWPRCMDLTLARFTEKYEVDEL